MAKKKSDIFIRNDFEIEEDTSWLITYADVVSLLLVFFVIFFSVSKVNLGFFEQFKESMSGSLSQSDGKTIITPLSDIKQRLDSLLQDEIDRQVVVVDLGFEGITLEFASSELYPSGSAELKPQVKPILLKIVEAINTITYYPFSIKVEGHTDNVPIKSIRYPSNWELSSARAAAVVKDILNGGLDSDRVLAIGYADTKPLVPNEDEFGRGIRKNQQQNRRTLITIY